jgi:2-C-methyl-D-erythritol 2,4-cyclodiphosphate synthase
VAGKRAACDRQVGGRPRPLALSAEQACDIIAARVSSDSQPRSGVPTTSGARIGIGHDTHRLAPGGPLRLGGIDVPCDRSAVGHSDADVLLHAVTDALLGAASLGDIGELFPDTDPQNRGRDSGEMLARVRDQVAAKGFEIVNVDCIVFAERPKLSAYKLAIRASLAALLGIGPECVGVKAKTGEGVGPVGREEAIMAECVVLLGPVPGSGLL